MQTAEAKRWTYEAYAALDDDQRYEVVDGELIMAAAPNTSHQKISTELILLIGAFIKQEQGGLLYHAPIDVILDDENIVQPDLVFISQENKGIVKKRGVFGRPDLVVEIRSPTSLKRDRHQKRLLYAQFAIPEFWLVDPVYQTIEVFQLEDGVYVLASFAEGKGVAASKVLEGLSIEVSAIMP